MGHGIRYGKSKGRKTNVNWDRNYSRKYLIKHLLAETLKTAEVGKFVMEKNQITNYKCNL